MGFTCAQTAPSYSQPTTQQVTSAAEYLWDVTPDSRQAQLLWWLQSRSVPLAPEACFLTHIHWQTHFPTAQTPLIQLLGDAHESNGFWCSACTGLLLLSLPSALKWNPSSLWIQRFLTDLGHQLDSLVFQPVQLCSGEAQAERRKSRRREGRAVVTMILMLDLIHPTLKRCCEADESTWMFFFLFFCAEWNDLMVLVLSSLVHGSVWPLTSVSLHPFFDGFASFCLFHTFLTLFSQARW